MDLNHRPPAPKFFRQTGTRRSAPVRGSLKLTSCVGFRTVDGQRRILRTSEDCPVLFVSFLMSYVTILGTNVFCSAVVTAPRGLPTTGPAALRRVTFVGICTRLHVVLEIRVTSGPGAAAERRTDSRAGKKVSDCRYAPTAVAENW
jgi:hypothetical protein